MSISLTTSIVRVLNANGQTTGTGFVLADHGLIATCAHVVERAGAGPGDTVRLVFHHTGDEASAAIEPKGWCAPEAEDIAVLCLDEPLPVGVKPLPLGLAVGTANHPFETFGFPEANPDEGLWGKGEILHETTLGGVRVLQLQSQEVTPGFSGAPIWNTATQRVVGMVTAITNPDDYGRLRDTAFATLSEVLLDVWPDLPLTQPSLLNTAPPLPDHFVARPAEFDQLLIQLLDDVTSDNKVAIPTVLQGGGGFGKTTLAQAICHHPRVQSVFSDAILWVELGQTPDLMGLLTDQINLFRPEKSSSTDINLATARLRKLLAERLVLFVLDDVWDDSHVRLFFDGWTTVITTRHQNVASLIRAQAVDVNEMNTDEAAALLVNWLDEPPPDWQPLQDLARYLGEWPLLLNLAGAHLRQSVKIDKKSLPQAIAGLRKRLNRKGFTYFDRTTDSERNQAVSISLELSLERLGQWRERYLELAIFPEEVDIPFITLERLWGHTANLDEIDSEDALQAMHRLSLFIRYDPVNQTVRLHDVIRNYLIEEMEDRLPEVHHQLLLAYGSQESEVRSQKLEDATHHSSLAGQGFIIRRSQLTLPFTDPYLWTYLAYHLIEAGRGDELVNSIKDLRYLAIKTHQINASAAELDLEHVTTHAPNDVVLRRLQRSFVQAGHLLNRCERLTDLAATLYSRLQHLEDLKPFTRSFVDNLTAPYLTLWHPLPDLPHPALRRTLVGHTAQVRGCAISPDGSLIVSASWDNSLKVWDGQSGTERLTLQGHQDRVNACAISADGSLIVSASDDHTLKVWDAQNGVERLTLAGHTDEISSCAINPDGSLVVSGSHDYTLKVWDVRSGTERLTLAEHTAEVSGCAISADGATIVSASVDHTLKVWDGLSGTVRLTLRGHKAGVVGCTISADGSVIVSASLDNTLKVWDAHSGIERLTLAGHTAEVEGCVISTDKSFIVSVSADETLKGWNAQSGDERQTLWGHTVGLSGCAISADGSVVVSSSYDKTLKVWDTGSETEALTPAGNRAPGISGVVSADGSVVVSTSIDRTLKIWDAYSGTERRTLAGHADEVSGCGISPDGSLIVSGSLDATIKVWDAHSGTVRQTLKGYTGVVHGCGLSPDGTVIVSSSADHTLKVWDVQSGTERFTLVGHTAAVNGFAISADGTFIVSASDDHTLKIWDIQHGTEVLTLSGHTARISDCTISADDSFIVSASDDHTLMIWDTQSGAKRRTLRGHTAAAMGLDISKDGSVILSGSADYTLKVWDTLTGTCLATLAVDGPLYSCAWFPDGRRIMAVGGGGVYFLQFVR
jgi:WD40 repeat protein